MKKLIIISLLIFSSTLFADTNIGVRIQAPIGNSVNVNLDFKSDNHRYDKRYKNFDYQRNGYYDDYGYFFGYFDSRGYFYNNIFFTYNSKYRYKDRINHKRNFSPKHVHYRPYKYHKVNNWNKARNYRKENQTIYGKYYDRNHHRRNK
ncbi:hypothetical protein KO488_01950 [Poseidonibacter lekithochrous]|uniref:hypothetical protein n=1 Tax=Poseidonibacter TaxID=2321187 RepID=UPI001C0A62DD|nr:MULTISPECIES: hypothetical protein [Poseidonibacter]MBU3013504.1 hypothetical protein [Poseidonibacter lekithochrous]MDO6826801.1 hypothetical protein [Poseidonibacter sp. 1_MG-2023]